MTWRLRHLLPGGGGGGTQKSFIRGDSSPRSNPRRRYPFWAEAPPAVPVLGHYSEYPLGLLDDDRPVSRTYMLTQAVHCSSLSLLEKRSAFQKKKIMVEQWNRDGGRVKHLMVEQWNRECGTVDHLMVEQWNIWWWKSGTSHGGTVEDMIV